MNFFYEYPEPAHVKFKAAVLGHPPAETCYQKNAKKTAGSS